MRAQPQFELIGTHGTTVTICFLAVAKEEDGRDAPNLVALGET
jgi:hypothetical protein